MDRMRLKNRGRERRPAELEEEVTRVELPHPINGGAGSIRVALVRLPDGREVAELRMCKDGRALSNYFLRLDRRVISAVADGLRDAGERLDEGQGFFERTTVGRAGGRGFGGFADTDDDTY